MMICSMSRLSGVPAEGADLLGGQREAALRGQARGLSLPVGPHEDVHGDHSQALRWRPPRQLSLHTPARG